MAVPYTSFVATLAQQAIQIVESVDPGLVVAVVYTPGSQNSYDITTGLVTQGAKPIKLKGVLSRFGDNEKDHEVVVSTDARLLVSGLDLGVYPNNTDTLTVTDAMLGTTTNWKVIRVYGVPSDAVWRVHIRRI